MNLMNFFSAPNATANPFQQQQPAAPAPQQPAPQQDPQLGGQPAGPGSQLQQGQTAPQQQPVQNPVNPLDKFTDLFKTDPQKPVENPLDFSSKPLLPADFDALQKSVDAASFAPQVTPEVMQKIMSGDVQTFQNLLAQASQTAFMQAARFSHGMVETGFKNYQGRLDQALPTRFQDLQTRNLLESQHPAFQHEAARPVIEALRGFVVQQMPNATAQQQSEKIVEYLRALAPQQQQQQQVHADRDPVTGQPLRQQGPATNWGKWLNS